jgi:hypothetical protein
VARVASTEMSDVVRTVTVHIRCCLDLELRCPPLSSTIS